MFDNQRTDDPGRFWLFVLGEFRFFVPRLHERQDGDRLGVRFIDIGIERGFDLGRHVGRVAGEPHVFAGFNDGRGEFAEHHRYVRALIESILPANRFDRAAIAALDGDADSVATDQASAFVGNRVRGFADVEFFVRACG